MMYFNEARTLFYTTTRSGRITVNTTNWRAAQYRNWWWMCWSSLVEYVCQYSAGVFSQCSYLQVFFIIKVYFPNLDWVGGSWNKFGKIRWALKWVTKLVDKICDLPPAHPTRWPVLYDQSLNFFFVSSFVYIGGVGNNTKNNINGNVYICMLNEN
jgi:hypothetical protein